MINKKSVIDLQIVTLEELWKFIKENENKIYRADNCRKLYIGYGYNDDNNDISVIRQCRLALTKDAAQEIKDWILNKGMALEQYELE